MQTNSLSSNAVPLRERVRQAARQIESEIIIEALEQHRWNRRRAAEALKISYRSLMYKMKNCNLRDDSRASGAGQQ
jgi:DNA-binding NtrC family response regulator